MAKFTKSETKKSLLENLTLMKVPDQDEWVWAEFHEIKHYASLGFHIFNDQKNELYFKMLKSGQIK